MRGNHLEHHGVQGPHLAKERWGTVRARMRPPPTPSHPQAGCTLRALDRAQGAPAFLRGTMDTIPVRVFSEAMSVISSEQGSTATLKGNEVLAIIATNLEAIGFLVERPGAPVTLPVLFGEGARPRRSYRADAWWPEEGVVVEVEAGGARQNNRAILDIMKGMIWQDCKHLIIAVKKSYGRHGQNDYDWLRAWVELIYASERFTVPMDTLTVVGY